MQLNHQLRRKKRFFTWVFLTLLLITGRCFVMANQEELELLIDLPPHLALGETPTYNQEDKIECHICLRNKSKKKITANTRLSMGYKDSAFGEIYFKIIGPDEEEVKPISKMGEHTNPAGKENFEIIKPNGSTPSKSYDLNTWYEFDKKGEYKITAIYENKSGPEGITVWIGKVKSIPPVKIQLK